MRYLYVYINFVFQNQFGGTNQYKLLLAKNIQRPQLKWRDKIDNSNTPFVPYLKEKPNALKAIDNGELLKFL